MSQLYKSGRQQNLNLGITSVTENRTVLQTIGKVGIGTTNAQQHSLFVVGSTNITSDVNVDGESTFAGITTVTGSTLFVKQIDILGVSTFRGPISNGSTFGNNGQYLKSTGSGIIWEDFPTLRTENNFLATSGQTSFTVSYTVGFVDVYLNGVRLTATEYTATNGTSVVLNESCFGGEAVDILAYNTTSTGGGSGSGINTESQTLNDVLGLGNTSNLGISVGVITATTLNVTDSRLQSVSEKSTVVSGNTVNLVYNAGGGNVAICTNPSGEITLNVTGIPTDSSFDNRTLNFTIIAIQSTTGYACTTINLNGVSRTVKYPGGVVPVPSTSSYDIFNFTGINTVGSGSTTANYQILGILNGNFK